MTSIMISNNLTMRIKAKGDLMTKDMSKSLKKLLTQIFSTLK